MKLAVVDHMGNRGGGSRLVRALLPALRACRPGMEIVYFGNPSSIKRENTKEEFLRIGIKVKELKSARFVNIDAQGTFRTSKIIRLLQDKFGGRVPFLPPFLAGAVHKEVERAVKGFDLSFFPWPYLMECPQVEGPMVAIFHDFNYKYFFGARIYTAGQLNTLNRQMPVWLEKATPVASTYFMRAELGKFYPEYADKVKVVHLASFSLGSDINVTEAEEMLKALGINSQYVIYPTHLTIHKNIGPLLSAISLLREGGQDISLVLTGSGTEMATGRACMLGVEKDNSRPNVIGLGYVTNRQMDALIQCAAAVVTSSLYEAGNGPGLDGWARGVPVAMSNIPPFLEHMAVQGVRAEVFDPRNPRDIADKIRKIILNPAKAKADALYSKEAFKNWTWTEVAKKYLSIFDEALERSAR